MAKLGRPPNAAGPKVRWELWLDPILSAEVRLLLTDPMRDKPRYGEISRLMEQLLRVWVDEQRKQRRAET